MIKENKYISLPLAKELQKVAKENKFQLPESEYAWDTKRNRIFKIDDLIISSIKVKFCFAYDCSELGEILPNQTIIRKDYISITDNILYDIEVATIKMEIIFDKNLAETMGKMWIYLIKNKLI